MQRFMDRLEAYYGKRPIIYTSVDFHRDNLVGHVQALPFLASAPWRSIRTKIYEDRRWAFWQYTSTGIVPGIKGQTDINVFAGSTQELAELDAAVRPK